MEQVCEWGLRSDLRSVCACSRVCRCDDTGCFRAVPEKVAVVYTKGHVVSITCPMQPQSAPYQRSIPVALEQAAKTLSEPSVNTNPGANASHAEANAPVAQQPQQRQNQKAQRWPHQHQHQHQHYQPVKSQQRPELEKRERQRQREQEPQQTPRWQREETNGRSKGAAAQASSKRQHHQQQSHSNRENRKDYVRAPPRECAGRYCRRNWHGTHGPHSVAPRRDEEDVVVFVADEAKGHNETGAGPAVFSVSEILQEEGELDVEKYIKAIQVDLARIKNVV